MKELVLARRDTLILFCLLTYLKTSLETDTGGLILKKPGYLLQNLPYFCFTQASFLPSLGRPNILSFQNLKNMAQFIPFSDKVEVNGQTVMATVTAFPDFMKLMGLDLLEKNGLKNINLNGWYSQKGWLDTFRQISEKYGEHTLFGIGKKIPENAVFPPQIQNLEQALAAIDIAYRMNHRNGEIGYYKLVSFDSKSKKALMECHNPYPCSFDKGIITTMARRFNQGNGVISVELDTTKPSRQDGGEKSWYNINW